MDLDFTVRVHWVTTRTQVERTVFLVRVSENEAHSAAELGANDPEVSPPSPKRPWNVSKPTVVPDALDDQVEPEEGEADETDCGARALHGWIVDCATSQYGL